MKKLFAAFVLSFLFLYGCGSISNVVVKESPTDIGIIAQNVRVLGIVHDEQNRLGILGFKGISGITGDFFLYQEGGISYQELLKKAKNMGADEIVNIKVETLEQGFPFIYSQTTYYVSALAVQYISVK